MRKMRIFIIILMSVVGAFPALAGHVADIAARLGLENVRGDTLLRRESVSRTKDIVVCAGGNGIDHVGLSLFSPEFKDIVDREICNFVERVLLDVALQSSSSDGRALLKRMKVGLRLGEIPYGNPGFTDIRRVVDRIEHPSSFDIRKADAAYEVEIRFGSGALVLNFPSSRELIYGKDKKESDCDLFAMLERGEDSLEKPQIRLPSGLEQYGDGMMMMRGRSFLLDRLNDTSFYTSVGNEPVWCAEQPEESLRNALLGVADGKINLRLRHRMYGGFTPDLEIALSDLQIRFGAEFERYAAVERLDDGRLQCVLVLRNSRFDFIHMLVMSGAVEDYFSPDSIMESDFFSNIPQNYIKSLF